ncbi:unnamed protein product [Orchesella dallaii]|uniref:FAM13A-like domain-containing protein n=1 Tax=Orchesella dallaii TaxID=48710 RepID=A0ABP1QP49_9HEXA
MFKFRKPSICSSVSPEPDLLSETESVRDSVRQAGRSGQGDSVSESRFSIIPKDDPSDREAVSITSIEQEIVSQHRRGSASIGSLQLQGLSDSNGSLHGKTMLDRKRKERHESTSQGQEKKVIRSVSDDESVNDCHKNSDFRRTLSHDSFSTKKDQHILGYTIEMRKPLKHESAKNSSDALDASVSHYENINSVNLIMSAEPQFDVMRKITVSENYEPELQRQLERSANWSSTPPTMKKTHKRRHRTSKHSSTKQPLDIDVAGGDYEEELHSPASESSSTDSVEDEGNNNGIPSVEIEEVEDVTSQTSDRLMALDFSNPQRNFEPSNVFSLRAALGGTSADDEVMLSPRNSVLGKEGIDIPPSPPLHQAPMDPPISRQGYLDGNPVTKMNELSRQITALKRQVKSLEREYEQVYGYRPSHSDKLNHKEMRKCVLQLSKAKKELKQIREDPSCLHDITGYGMGTGNVLCVSRGNSVPPTKGTPEYAKYLESSVRDVERNLSDRRRSQNRPDDLERMNSAQLQEEKCLMQRQLLVLEKRHGRPSSKQEKDIVRPLYDRYRAIKRFSVKIVSIRDASIDLVPIMEHEPLELYDGSNEPPRVVAPAELWGSRDRGTVSTSAEDDARDIERNESFNEMTLSELEGRQKQAKDEKRRMRAAIRKFEADFQNMAGRPPQKDEKYSSSEMELAYQKYKRIKGTVRLLEVLINKRKCPNLIQDMSKNED